MLETPDRNRPSFKLKGLVKPIKYPMCLGLSCIHIKAYSKEELELLLKQGWFKKHKNKGSLTWIKREI